MSSIVERHMLVAGAPSRPKHAKFAKSTIGMAFDLQHMCSKVDQDMTMQVRQGSGLNNRSASDINAQSCYKYLAARASGCHALHAISAHSQRCNVLSTLWHAILRQTIL